MKRMRTVSVQDVATWLGAQAFGDTTYLLSSVAALEIATEKDLSYCEANRFADLENTKAGAVLVTESHKALCPTIAIVVPDPKLALATVTAALLVIPAHNPIGIHPTAVIADSARIDPTASIGPACVVGEDTIIEAGAVLSPHVVIGPRCRIGKGTSLSSHVTLYEDVHLGEQCVVQAGAVIGSEGFGFVPSKSGWTKLPQMGGVRIGRMVEIGANTTIDCGALQDTIIEDGVILDNQIQIGHNVHIGAFTAIAGCVGIAGSAKIGKYCLIGGGSGIAGHIAIADKVHLEGMSSVTKSITQPGVYSSVFGVRPHMEWKRAAVRMHGLDKLAERVKLIEKRLKELG